MGTTDTHHMHHMMSEQSARMDPPQTQAVEGAESTRGPTKKRPGATAELLEKADGHVIATNFDKLGEEVFLSLFHSLSLSLSLSLSPFSSFIPTIFLCRFF